MLGYCGALRDAHDRATPLRTTVVAATIGFLAGLIFWRLRWMRDRGGVYYYFSWGLSVAGGTALFLLPSTIKNGEWLSFALMIVFAMTGGFGLAAFIVMAVIEHDRKSSMF